MDSDTNCPEESVITSILAGQLEAEEEAEVAAHIEGCTRCQELLESLARLDEGLAGKLKDLDSDANHVPHGLMRRLAEDMGIATDNGAVDQDDVPREEIDLSFLEHSEEGSLGKLGAYEITEIVGQGGMGMVPRGYDARLNRCIAIKVLAPQRVASAVARKQFLREARAAAAVSHEHVVRTYAVDEVNGMPFIVMEYIEGISLDARIARDGALSVPEILRIGMQAASGLAAAHAQGLVHRDITPSNILLENDVERVKITDFGLARAADDVEITQAGVLAGTPRYMSPEQVRSEGLDARSDLFSLGCVLYAMSAGCSPFRAPTVFDAVRRICDDTPRPLKRINPGLPDWLVETIEQLLRKDPAERFQSAAELAELLGSHLARIQLPAAAAKPRALSSTKSNERSHHTSHRRSWLVATAMVTLVGLIFGGAWGVTEFFGSNKPRAVHPPPADAVDLLEYIEPTRDAPLGCWKFQRNDLVTFDHLSYCRIPYVFPDEYDVVAVVERRSGEKAIGLGMHFGDRFCWASIDWAPAKGYVSGLQRADGTFIQKGYQGPLLLKGTPATIRWKVRRDGEMRSIEVTCNDQLALKWKGHLNQLASEEPAYNASFHLDGRNDLLSTVHPGVNHIHRLHMVPHSDDGYPFFSKNVDSPDRIVAEHVLWYGGSVWIAVNGGKELEIEQVGELPESFQLTGFTVIGVEEARPIGKTDLPLGELKHLRRLVLIGPIERCNEILLDLPASRNLEEVVLANTPTTDIGLAQLNNSPVLKSVDLSFTRVTNRGLAELGERSSLRRLCLAGTEISDGGVERLAELERIEYLDLSGAEISNNALGAICKLTNLQELKLDYTAVDDAALEKLVHSQNLLNLSLSGTGVSDSGMVQLAELKNLDQLSVIGTRVSKKGIQALRERLPECTVVHSTDSPVDILELITSGQPTVDGLYELDGDSLLMSATDGLSYFSLPCTPPDEYLLQFDGEFVSGNKILHFGLVSAGRPFLIACPTVILGRCITGLERIDTRRVDFNETTDPWKPFTPSNTAFSLSASVVKDRIAVTFNDQSIVDWSGDPKRLTKYTTLQPDGLSIAPHSGRVRIERIELWPIVRTGGDRQTGTGMDR